MLPRQRGRRRRTGRSEPRHWLVPLLLTSLFGCAAIVVADRFNSYFDRVRTPSDAVEAIARRPFWQARPDVFKPSASSNSTATVRGGDVVALDPRGALEQAGLLDGRTVYVVGRVISHRSTEDRFAIRAELRLTGTDRAYAAFVALSRYDPHLRSGDLVFVSGSIVAVGTADVGGGREIAAVYLLAVGRVDVGRVSERTGSRAIRKVAARLRR